MYKRAGVFLELITDSNGFRNDDEAAAEGVFSADIHSPEIPNMEITRIGRYNFIVVPLTLIKFKMMPSLSNETRKTAAALTIPIRVLIIFPYKFIGIRGLQVLRSILVYKTK